jgi:hypothetical protein
MSDMQKWEYILVQTLGEDDWEVRAFFPKAYRLTSNGFELIFECNINKRDAMESAVASFIAQLGAEGWEMVGTGSVSGRWYCIYFKRPIP